MCILFLWHGQELENESGEKTWKEKRFGKREAERKRVRIDLIICIKKLMSLCVHVVHDRLCCTTNTTAKKRRIFNYNEQRERDTDTHT